VVREDNQQVVRYVGFQSSRQLSAATQEYLVLMIFSQATTGKNSLIVIFSGAFMKRWIAGAAALMVVASQAETVLPNRSYVELGYSAISYEVNALGYGVNSTPKAMRGVLGYEANDNVAVEFMAAGGLGHTDADASGQAVQGLTYKINSLYGAYVTPKAQVMNNLEVFVRLGYVHSRGTAALGGDSAVNTDNGFSYGAGMRYHFDRTTFLNVDYMSYLHKSDYTAKGLTVGVGFKF
jgi:hypothetical protein